MDIKEEVKTLREQIEYHSNRYYNMDAPEITDYEYDMLMQRLKQIEKEHPELVDASSPTQKVGGNAKREAGVLVRHNVPMLSLQDVFSKEEVMNFVAEMQENWKILSLSLSTRSMGFPCPCATSRANLRWQRPEVMASTLARMLQQMPR